MGREPICLGVRVRAGDAMTPEDRAANVTAIPALRRLVADEIRAAVEAAVMAERERCALIARVEMERARSRSAKEHAAGNLVDAMYANREAHAAVTIEIAIRRGGR